MQLKKKALVGKGKRLGEAEAGSKTMDGGNASLSQGVVSMRRVVAKKLAVEKLVTAKRLG